MGNGIVFRCDFGGTRGWGHVVRCSSLARAARAKGLQTCLVSQAQVEWLPEEVQEAFDAFHQVGNTIPMPGFWDSLLSDGKWGAVVVDHYDYARRELALLKQSLYLADALLIVIDDEATRELVDADIIVNHVLRASPSLYPGHPNVLAGEEYALIRPGFSLEDTDPPHEVEGLKSLRSPATVMFGGTDARNLSGASLRYLREVSQGTYDPILVRSRQIAFRDEIDKELRRARKSLWLDNLSSDDLSACFRKSRFVITACGGSVYEVAYCRTPFIGIVVAPNQVRLAQAIEQQWGMPILKAEAINRKTFTAALEQIEKMLKTAARKERRPYSGIDGEGPRRVIDAFLDAREG